jgi:hypothetical protein
MAQLSHTISETLSEMISSSPRIETPLERFNAKYLTAQEIMDRIDVTRPTVIHRMNTRFPSIKVGNTYIWERNADSIAFINAWEVYRELGE